MVQEMVMESLEDLRKSIDNIDNAIVALLAERFKVTNRVGHFKASHKLPAKDPERQALQHARIQELSLQYGLDPEFASSILAQIVARVVIIHEQIAKGVEQALPHDGLR
jgi:chorismate mutase